MSDCEGTFLELPSFLELQVLSFELFGRLRLQMTEALFDPAKEERTDLLTESSGGISRGRE